MKKTLSVVLALLMVLAAIPAFAAPVEIDYWSVFTGADGATMQATVADLADGAQIAHMEKPDLTAKTLTDDPADGVYAATVGRVSDSWLTFYPRDEKQLVTLPAGAVFHTVLGDRPGSGYVPEADQAPDEGAYNAIVVVENRKISEIFVNEDSMWK